MRLLEILCSVPRLCFPVLSDLAGDTIPAWQGVVARETTSSVTKHGQEKLSPPSPLSCALKCLLRTTLIPEKAVPLDGSKSVHKNPSLPADTMCHVLMLLLASVFYV